MWAAAALALLMAASGGCAKRPVQAAPAPAPPLEVPVPPPRVLAPAPEPDATPPEKEPRPEPTRTPSRPRPAPRAGPGTGESRPDPARPETPPTEPAVGAPAPDARRPSEAPGLRTPQTANDAEAERRVREVLTRATRDLERVDPRALGADARAQFDTARRFIDQAAEALKVRNYLFAGYLADKAEALARGVAGR